MILHSVGVTLCPDCVGTCLVHAVAVLVLGCSVPSIVGCRLSVLVVRGYPVPELLVDSKLGQRNLLTVVSNKVGVDTTVCTLYFDLERCICRLVPWTGDDALHVGLNDKVPVVAYRNCLASHILIYRSVPDLKVEGWFLDVECERAFCAAVPLIPVAGLSDEDIRRNIK